jgi:hypothetical protein
MLSISYSEFRERVPRLDQQARIAWMCIDLMYKDGVNNLRDLIAPTGQPDTESRMVYVERRAKERKATLEPEIESYILDKGFGTETSRAIIRHRQEHPAQAESEESTWLM